MKFSELTTTKLSSDNSLLKEELEMTREQLIDAKKALASQKAQLQTLKMENELKEESERKPSAQKKVHIHTGLTEYYIQQLTGPYFHSRADEVLLSIGYTTYTSSMSCLYSEYR